MVEGKTRIIIGPTKRERGRSKGICLYASLEFKGKERKKERNGIAKVHGRSDHYSVGVDVTTHSRRFLSGGNNVAVVVAPNNALSE